MLKVVKLQLASACLGMQIAPTPRLNGCAECALRVRMLVKRSCEASLTTELILGVRLEYDLHLRLRSPRCLDLAQIQHVNANCVYNSFRRFNGRTFWCSFH